MADRDPRPSFRRIPAWVLALCFIVGAPCAWYGFGHIDEWPRRGPGGGEGANHLAVLAATVGGWLVLVAVLIAVRRRR